MAERKKAHKGRKVRLGMGIARARQRNMQTNRERWVVGRKKGKQKK